MVTRYKCPRCGEIFTEDEQGEKEDYFCHDWMGGGVEYFTIPVCPYCGEEDFNEIEDDEDESI